MTDETLHHSEDHENAHHPRRNIVYFIIGSVLVAFALVLVSMSLYISSGAAQLDLSRPGYKAVQNEVEPSDTFVSFPASGEVDNTVIEQFLKLFRKQVKPVDNTDVFSPAALDEQALGLDSPPAEN